MSIALLVTDRDLSVLQAGLQQHLPAVDIQCWPNISNPENVEFVVAWQQPKNCWQQFPHLKVVSSLGAGCDGLLNDNNLPQNITITRIVDSDLAEQMAEYVLTSILIVKRRFTEYFKQQQQKKWQNLAPHKGKKVAVLGIGAIGHQVAQTLVQCGYQVTGWSRSKKEPRDYDTYYGQQQLKEAVNEADFLVSTLPLTKNTPHFLNKQLFALLPKHTWLINVGRGQVLNEHDLLTALANKNIQGAVLDVFSNEPLPANHAFWQQKNIIITPHISAITDQNTIISQIAKNYLALKANKPLNNNVNRQNGY
jgi:glyoxylate/hydroxypyruvate reductase